jgi:hypothetical protein
MFEYNYNKQVNPDILYLNIQTNVGIEPSFFNYNNITFDIKIKFEEELTVQQEQDLDDTVNNYIYEEAVRVFSLLPVVGVDNSQYNISYVGYGLLNACKIQKITTEPTSYTTAWAGGNEVFDKIWNDRYNYTYF